MEYMPDNWIVLKIKEDERVFYKVLAGWSGGYLDGNSWRMNSGITGVEETSDKYIFMGASGSQYFCRKNGYGIRFNIAGIYNQLTETFKDKVVLMPEDSNWTQLDWGI